MTISEASVDELESALQAGAVLIDVRQPDEYEAGHVPGAVLVPLASVPDALELVPLRERVTEKRLLANGDAVRLGKVILMFNLAFKTSAHETTQGN